MREFSYKIKPQHKTTGYGDNLTDEKIQYVEIKSVTVEHDRKKYIVINVSGEPVYIEREDFIKAGKMLEVL